MKNLAGVKEADEFIREELYLAGIEPIPEKSEGEVPYTIIGRIGNWKLRRAWRYWVARAELKTDGIPVDKAMELYNRKNPNDDNRILGLDIRAGGDAGCSPPNEYTSQPVYDDELEHKLVALGYEKKYSELMGRSYVNINYGEIARLCNEGKLDVPRYADSYHIDTQVGLCEFVKFLRSMEK
jgi:hypothetical protein